MKATISVALVCMMVVVGCTVPSISSAEGDIILNIAILNDIISCNPAAVSDTWSWNVLEYIYDRPMCTNPETDALIPYIAVGSANLSSKTEGWDWDDCTIGNFGLNPESTWTGGAGMGEAVVFYDFENVTWHDGTQMSIRDVMFSMHMIAQIPKWTNHMNPLKAGNFTGTGWLEVHKVWESPDSLRAALRFELQEPYAGFLYYTLNHLLLPYHIWGGTVSGQNNVDAKIWCDPGYDPLAADSWKVAPAQAYENNPPIGSGIFEFNQWNIGQSIRIDTYRNHFFRGDYKYTGHVLDWQGNSLAKQPNIDGVVYKIYRVQEQAVLALRTGQVDFIARSVIPSFLDDISDDPGITVVQSPTPGFHYVGYNMRRESFGYRDGDPLNEDIGKPLRKAIAHCIDRPKMVSRLLMDHGIVAKGPVCPISPWFNNSVPYFPFDPHQAKVILSDAGYKVNDNGTLLSGQAAIDAAGPGNWWVNPDGSHIGSGTGGMIEILTTEANYDAIMAQAGLMIAMQLKNIGINADSVAMNYNSLLFRVEERDFDMYLLGCNMDNGPREFLWEFFHSVNAQSGLNHAGYRNASHDAIMDQARWTRDEDLARKNVRIAQSSIGYDLPYDAIFFSTNIEAYRSDRFVGWVVGRAGSIFNRASLVNIAEGVPLPPRIVDAIPADGSANILTGAGYITIMFSMSMKAEPPTQLPSTNIPGIDFAGAFWLEARWEIPHGVLEDQTLYYMNFSGVDVFDLGDRQLVGDKNLTFTTGDFTPPFIVSTVPLNGTTGILPAAGSIHVKFSKPMEPAFPLTPRTNIPGTDFSNAVWSNGNVNLTIPHGALEELSFYYIDFTGTFMHDPSFNQLVGENITFATGSVPDADPSVPDDDDPVEPGDDDEPANPVDDDDDPADDDDDPVEPGDGTVPVAIGPVMDQEDNPIPGANVTVVIGGNTYYGTTNETGFAVIGIPEDDLGGLAEITITKEGYDPYDFEAILGTDGTSSAQPPPMNPSATPPPGDDDEVPVGLGNLWIILIIAIAVAAIAFMLKGKGRDPELAGGEPEVPTPQEPVPEPPETVADAPPSPGDPRIAKLKQAYADGKISQEMYEKNLQKFGGIP